MKKITIRCITNGTKSHIYTKLKHHTVSIGNGITVRFSNLVDAKAYVVELNADLNFNLVIISRITSELYSNYRLLWFYMNNLRDFSRIESNIKNSFESVEHAFGLMVTRSHWENGAHFTFKHLFQCLDSLDLVCEALQSVELQRKEYTELRILQSISNRIDIVRNELKQMGIGKGSVFVAEGAGTMA